MDRSRKGRFRSTKAEAEAAGVRHVTYLSAYGIDLAPPEVALRAVELDLMACSTLTHSVLRP